ncbi:MAG: tRNA (cytidine(34)-2'-O)-methyltransferase [Caulobacterales bacterium]
MRLVLYQPDIPQNLGAIIRLGACLDLPIEVVEPCGFPLTDAKAKRAALDYGETAALNRHASWGEFLASGARKEGRLVLFSTKATALLQDFAFERNDLLMFGRESAGVPADVANRADALVRIPLKPGSRSLNVAMSAGIAAFEAMRQTGGLSGKL